MDMIELLMEIIGWIGAIALLGAYLLISNGKIIGKSYSYQSLNLIGSFGLCVNTYYHGAMPSVVLNVIWLSIGLNTVRILIKNSKQSVGE